MKKYVKIFLHRGAVFGGFGPIVAAIVYLILSYTAVGITLSGQEVFLAVISTYILAFIHAGASVFNQIEHWPLPKSILFHLAVLYFGYTACYLVNSWLPFDWRVVLIFTAVFVAVYAVVWLTVLVSIKVTQHKLNKKLIK